MKNLKKKNDGLSRKAARRKIGPSRKMVERKNLEVFDPTGAFEITQFHAPRLPDLNGMTIGEISNGGWQAHRTFPLIREELLKRFPTARIIPYTEFVKTRAQCEDLEFVAEMVKTKACQAVIAGNAS